MDSPKLFEIGARQLLLALLGLLMFCSIPSQSQRLLVFPCVNMEAIKWVRDPVFCDQYYICHFGQPLAMPSCPSGQVWSNGALNCVPEGSRWDDCAIKEEEKTAYTVPDNRDNDVDIIALPPTTTPRVASPRHVHRGVTRTDSNNGDHKMIISVQKLPDYPTEAHHQNIPEAQTENHVQKEIFPPIFTTRKSLPQGGIITEWRGQESQAKGQVISWYTKAPLTTNATQRQIIWTPAPWIQKKLEKMGRNNNYVQVVEKTTKAKERTKQGKLPKSTLSHYVDPGHPCLSTPGAFLPHPDTCHWYYNCSLANLENVPTQATAHYSDDDIDYTREGFYRMEPFRVVDAGVFVWECRYPQLFDDVTMRCREFINVDCKSRFEAVDQCEYSQRQCVGGHCMPCERRFGYCRERPDGVYPLHELRWTPVFLTCYRERNIAQDECAPPTPIFSPERLDCVSLFEVVYHSNFVW
ncbi:uncharacterized protein LOC118479190 [Aplysia californica]|uniref:Uncharacterized protein LOC118479190 n=1 Tax=Aplysia californica TaxID=6500 RepID=A0ABM1W557_APLCA|nr:uncharacterized protein LOC118479190 [Aplysia californica]